MNKLGTKVAPLRLEVILVPGPASADIALTLARR